MIIEKFKPDFFPRHSQIDNTFLEQMFGHNLQYASKGRNCIRHILASSGRSGAVVMPVYACSSIPAAIIKTGNEIIFCDNDERDLNINVDAFKAIISKRRVAFLLAPSLYGNPADLIKLEQICRENDIYMIDDAAQCFGAKINDRYVGSYGNAGFFSFSPGKQLTGSMGAYFWTENKEYRLDYNYCHKILHKVAFEDFYYNRFKIYERGNYSPYKLFAYLNILLQKVIDIVDDGLFDFEEDMLGALIEEYKKGTLNYRQDFYNSFLHEFGGEGVFRVIKNIRGTSNNQKIVLVFDHQSILQRFRDHLSTNGIYTAGGYKMLDEANLYPNASNLDGRIVEIPIENSIRKMDYLKKVVEDFLN